MSCKGICFLHKAQKPQAAFYGLYAAGQCDIFIYWNNLWCLCCGYRLRIQYEKEDIEKHLEQKNTLR
jgi:hypothetical protein